MSLSRLAKKKNADRSPNVSQSVSVDDSSLDLRETDAKEPDLPPPPLLVRQNGYIADLDITEPDEEDDLGIKEPKSYQNCLFITDCDVSQSIKDQLDEYKGFKAFERDLFSNRDCKVLKDMNVSHLWINIKNKHARKWLSQNIKKNKEYLPIIAYAGPKTQKWINDLSSVVDKHHIIKASDIKKLRSLNFDELNDKLRNLIEIHPPVGKLLSCLGLTSLSKVKKKD